MKIYFKKNKVLDSIPRKFYADWIKPVFPDLRHGIYGISKQDLILSVNRFKPSICSSPKIPN